MSIPPNTPPPFSQYGTPPPPGNYSGQPRNSSGGCWKAAGITCGVLLVLVIIGIIVGVNAFKHAMKSHSGVFGEAMDIGTTMGNGLKIQKAVVAYHTAHGKYPDNLTTLVADGSLDGKLLHSPLDPNKNPGHISWTYHKPTESSPPNAELLSMHYTFTIPGQNAPQSTNSDIVINLDGTTSSNSGSPSTSPSGP